MTKVIEMENQICFSKQPIWQCPRGSYPNGWYNGENINEKIQEIQQNQNIKDNTKNTQQNFTTKNIAFICLQRSDLETRQLLRQYRQNENYQINMSAYSQHSFVEKVHEPKTCRRA